MPRGLRLSEFERGQITELDKSGCSLREIARRLQRTVGVVRNYLADPVKYGSKHSSGRPKVLSERDRRVILQLASNSRSSINKIRAQAGVSASRWTVWRAVTQA